MTKRKADCTPEEWAANLARMRKYREANRAHFQTKERERAARRWADPEQQKRRRERNWQRMYGVDPSTIWAVLELQKNACAICLKPLVLGKHTHIDHCHETRRVRGVLCRACNQAEGHIKGSELTPAQFAERLQRYLDNPPASGADLV